MSLNALEAAVRGVLWIGIRVEDIGKRLLNVMQEQAPEFYLAFAQQPRHASLHVRRQTREICMAAVQRNVGALNAPLVIYEQTQLAP